MKVLRLFGVGLVLAAVLGGHTTQAVTWGNTAGGSFHTGANWVGGVPPTAAQNATFDSNATYAVTFTNSVTNLTMSFFAPAGTVTLDIGASNTYYSANVFSVQNNGGATSLDITNGTLNVNGDAYIGANYNGSRMTVRNPSAAFRTVQYDLTVGNDGSYNQLLVTNAATVAPYRSLILGRSATSSNNTAVVSGVNSRALGGSEYLYVGYSGDNNQLIVEDGGEASCLANGLNVGAQAGSDGNTVIVRSGSIQTNYGSVNVGGAGSYNAMTVTNASCLVRLYINVGASGSGSFNQLNLRNGGSLAAQHVKIGIAAANVSNTVVVAGSGATLRSTGFDVTVGWAGQNNLMIVSNGATVTAWRGLFVGAVSDNASVPGGADNTLISTGAGTVLESLGTASSYSVLVGRGSTNNALRLEDGAKLVLTNNASVPFVIGSLSSALSNSVFVGAGCVGTNTGSTYVGLDGTANSLTLSNGTFYASHTYCGNNATASRNTLTVEAGGQYLSAGYTWVGNSGSWNSLMVRSGGLYRSAGHFYFGSAAGANSNTITVTGSGSVLTNTQYDLDVGSSGSYNQMRIADGGSVTVTRDVFVGKNAASTNNMLEIEGGSLRILGVLGQGYLDVNYGSRLSVYGTGGVIQAKQILVRNNSKVNLRVDAGGITPITGSANATFDNTTRLTVDAERYQSAGGGTITVMTYTSRNQGILPGNITVMPADTIVTQTATSISLTVPGPEGTMIFLE